MANVKNLIIDGKKKCNSCGEVKDVSEYYPYKNNIRGSCKKCLNKKTKTYMANVSKEKKSEWWQRAWAKEEFRQKKYISAKERYKRIKQKSILYLGGKCIRCGYDKCIEALEFHHIDPSAKEKHHSGRGIDRRRSFDANKSELDKCILLCANCHREEHFNG